MKKFFANLALALAALTIASPATAMTFEKVSNGVCGEQACIVAKGEIEIDTAKDFRRFYQRERPARGTVVLLNSEGGNVMQALALGEMIRKAGLSTRVHAVDAQTGDGRGVYASACVYAFMGGVQRSVGEGSRLGVHQLHLRAGELSAADSQFLVSLIAEHILTLGGGMDILLTALNTPSHSMHWLSSSELRRFSVVTAENRELASASLFIDGDAHAGEM